MRAAASVAICAGAAACGRVGFEARGDARVDAAAPTVFGYTVANTYAIAMPAPITGVIGIVGFDPTTGAVAEQPAFDLGAPIASIVASPRGTALYASSYPTATIYELHVDAATGALSLAGTIATGTRPIALSIDPSGQWLYGADESGPRVWAYAIAADDTLAPLAGSPLSYPGVASDDVAFDPSGRWAFVVDEAIGGELYGFARQLDGSLVVQAGSKWSPQDAFPHAALFDATGRFGFIAPDMSGGIPGFTLDPASGALATTPGSRFAFGGNTSNFAATSPAGDILYMTNQSGQDIDAYAIQGDGSLTALRGSPLAIDGTTLGVAASPLGSYSVWTIGRPGQANALGVVRVDAAGVALVAEVPFASQPYAYQIVLVRTR